MNVDKEIEKYYNKKKNLLNNLLGRLGEKAGKLSSGIARTASVITDLLKKQDEDISTVKEITLKINSLKEEK